MQISTDFIGREQEIVELFSLTFSASEGSEEGARIGRLVHDLLHSTAGDDLYVFLALNANDLIGAVIFTRFAYDQDPRTVFLLSPLAVATEHQRKGIGQKLVTEGLNALKHTGIDIAVTYGDPNYYGRVGFIQISDIIAQPPFNLSMPEGWLAQSLNGQTLAPLTGPSRCVAALRDATLW